MSKTTLIATFARAGAPLYERATTAFIGFHGAVVPAKTRVFV
ncbi:hypothetical protein [Burkholderia contaminans]